jgi:hypothetical protein
MAEFAGTVLTRCCVGHAELPVYQVMCTCGYAGGYHVGGFRHQVRRNSQVYQVQARRMRMCLCVTAGMTKLAAVGSRHGNIRWGVMNCAPVPPAFVASSSSSESSSPVICSRRKASQQPIGTSGGTFVCVAAVPPCASSCSCLHALPRPAFQRL